MRVLLAQPPLVPEGPVQPPVSLATLASLLVNLGHQVDVLDLDLSRRQFGQDRPSDTMRVFADVFDTTRPDVVGVTSMYSNSLQAARLVAAAKEKQPEAVTVAGGSHFGALARESLLRNPGLDFVIQGEAETAFSELLYQIETARDWLKVPSLAYRHGEEVVLNAKAPLIDLAALPKIWENLSGVIDLGSYVATISGNSPWKVAYVEAGRGCPYHCSFCATAPFWQRKFRVKPIHRIIDEMRYLHRFGYNRFVLVHDLLTVSSRFVSDLCDALLEAKLPVQWMANSRSDIALDGLLPKMKAAGCWKLFFGVESASEDIQNACNKYLDVSGVYKTVEDLARHGLTATCSFVIGFPKESRRELASSVVMGARLKLLGAETVQFHRLRLWPPAEMADQGWGTEFDEISARIEYPFIEVPEDDLSNIRAHSRFFGGYFVPKTAIGTVSQIAQAEMLFHHAIAVAPMTVAALVGHFEDVFVDLAFQSFIDIGPLSRQDLDWEGGNIYRNWLTILPYLHWIVGKIPSHSEISTIVKEIIAYEDHRVCFTTGRWRPKTDTDRGNNGWCGFISQIDVPESISRLRLGSELSPSVLRECCVVLRREPDGVFRSFTGPVEWLHLNH